MQLIISNQIGMAAAQTTLTLEEAITNMKISGMSSSAIRQTLMDDLDIAGPLFGGFRSKIRGSIKNGIEYSSNGSSNGRFIEAGIKRFQWVSIGDGKVCPDCEEKHGEEGTMEFFELLGLPASGFSICGPNCRCVLVPASYKGENLDRPLVKDKKKFLKFEEGSAWTPRIKNKINASHDRLRSMGYKIPKQKPVEMIVGDDRPGGFFSAMSGDGKRLTVNHRLLFSKVSQKKLDDVVSAGLFPRGTNSASAMLDHEFAHAISSTISREAQNKINHIYKKYVSEINRKYDSPLKAIAKKRIEFFDKLKDAINQARISGATTHEISVMTKKGDELLNTFTEKYHELSQKKRNSNIFISDNAKKSIDEFMADSFTSLRYSKINNQYAKRVWDIIDEELIP